MIDLFTKKSRWFEFAIEHNKKANQGAKLLNGSVSYKLVAVYLAAGKEIPLSVLLDTSRKKGVSSHFKGLKQAYESGSGSQWLMDIIQECREVASEDTQLDSSEMINKIIEWTEKTATN